MKVFDALSENDLQAIRNLKFDPHLEPTYNFMEGTLCWSDEVPDECGPLAFDLTGTLRAARAYLYHNRPFDGRDGQLEFLTELSDHCKKELPNWPGSHPSRLSLTEEQQRFYQQALENALSVDDY